MRLKVFITGSTGFVGSNLARFFRGRGDDVSLLVRKSSDLQQVNDIKDSCKLYEYDGSYKSLEVALSTAAPDVVIHCASLFLSSHNKNDVSNLIDSNVKFPSMLLEAMSQVGITQFINTGTSWQHYKNEDYSPVNLYAATKQSFEQVLKYYLEIKKIKAITLKLFDTYGPSDNRGRLVSLLINKFKSGGRIDLSPGEQELSLVHIDDVVGSYEKSIFELTKMELGIHKQYGVGSKETYSLKGLVNKVAEVIDVDARVTVSWGGRAYREREVMAVWDKFICVPNWKENRNVVEYIVDEVVKSRD